jgi:hypothetical protein
MDEMAEWQWKRWDAVARLASGKLTTAEAAQVLGLSGRQFRRVRRAVEREGRRALLHGNRGRAPVNKLGAKLRARIVTLRRETYRDFNDQHFTEKLGEEHLARFGGHVRRSAEAGVAVAGAPPRIASGGTARRKPA